MTSRIEHRAEYAADVPAVLAAQSEEEPLRARLARLGGKDAALLEHVATEQGVRFMLRQGIAAERLPQAVRALHKGDLIVERAQSFTRAGAGTTRVTVSGVPGEITARTDLLDEGGKTVQRTVGEVKVRIPLVGGKLEAVIAEQVCNLLDREAEFTAEWLARG